ncbi:MAG: hypothetical protein L0Z53_00925 [Acidobacteriales bacterium]|nr:hypothetical protein [Terriglobales bacterium]
MSATGDLLDVNVWLAFALQGHPHHRVALAAWQDLDRPSFCRITQLSFIRMLCNRDVMGAQVLRPDTAWSHYEGLRSSGVVHYADEPPGLDPILKDFAKGAVSSRDFWTDAYLAAFAKSAGMRLVSFDSGFRKFKNLDWLLLRPA